MNIKEVIIEILADKALLNSCDICMNDSLVDLGIDSMGLVEFLFSVEEQLNLDFDINLNLEASKDFGLITVEEVINSFERIINEKDLDRN
ncbi:MAG: acyl carrier protein [Paracoccaceae bacterium]|nr:acyl carrier protein [Paracoccaceae bacterium]